MTAAFRPDKQPIAAPTGDPAADLIRHWPGMSAADKFAWQYLVRRSRCGREVIEVTATDIAADQAVSTDAGRDRIKNLTAQGFVTVVHHERATGVYTIQVNDPFSIARTRAVKWDGQYELKLDDEPQTIPVTTSRSATADCASTSIASTDARPALCQPGTEEPPEELPPEDPRRRGPHPHFNLRRLSKEKNLNNTFTFENLLPTFGTESTEGLATGRRGTSGGTPAEPADWPDEPSLSADAEVEELAWKIKRRVNCSKLRFSPCLKAAEAVVDGLISRHSIEELLENIDSLRRHNRLRSPASAYFNGGLKKLLERTAPKPK